MKRVNLICAHPLWKESVLQIENAEKERKFCRHGVSHFLDVARIAYTESLEQNLGISKELIYSAALLHDIGRAAQYKDGTPHETAGITLSEKILSDCGFTAEEKALILHAVQGHRSKTENPSDDLEGLISRADKLSRNCMFCAASDECKWSEEKKNTKILV